MRTLYPFSALLKAFAVYQCRNEAKNAMEKWFDVRVFAYTIHTVCFSERVSVKQRCAREIE